MLFKNGTKEAFDRDKFMVVPQAVLRYFLPVVHRKLRFHCPLANMKKVMKPDKSYRYSSSIRATK